MIFAAASIAFFFIFLLIRTLKNHDIFKVPINWPIVGMLPHLLLNLHRFHDYNLDILRNFEGQTFVFKCPLFTSMETVSTVDPANVHYIMSKNFKNYPKGDSFFENFEILGDGIFNADFELWRYQRSSLHSFLTSPHFNEFLVETVGRKMEVGLIPVLDEAYKGGHVVDLEDLFQRFTFDTICTLVTGEDPKYLSVELPNIPVCKALDDVEEALFHRQLLPKSIWKLQRWLCIGTERKLGEAWKILDSFLYKAILKRLEEASKKKDNDTRDWMGYIEVNDGLKISRDSKFLRDMFLNLLIAGRDTTSVALTWFFWLISKNQNIEHMLREEVKSISFQRSADLKKLVHLHGALCETLRLYPPVPFQQKSPLEHDTLPSGHKVSPKTPINIPLHTMGRDKSIWGDDCEEFKPERWITKLGRIKHEPSYKFLAFNAGPRTCLGKEMAFIQMKAVVSTIFLHGYQLQIVEEHKVEPGLSIILHTKHGLKAKVVKSTS